MPGRPEGTPAAAGQRPTRGVRGGVVCSRGCSGPLAAAAAAPSGQGWRARPLRPGGPCTRTAADGRTSPPGARAPAAAPSSSARRVHGPLAQRCDRETGKGRSPPGRSCHHRPRSCPRQEVLCSGKSPSRPSLLVLTPWKSTSLAFFPPLHLGAPGSVGPGHVGSCFPRSCTPEKARK